VSVIGILVSKEPTLKVARGLGRCLETVTRVRRPGKAATGTTRYERAHAQRAYGLFVVTNHRRGQARALNVVGWYHALLGNYNQAITCCQRAIVLSREVGEHDAEAATWDSLGYAQHHAGHYSKAAACYQNALHLFRALGDRHDKGITLTHLGDAHLALGDAQAAREIWQSALAILDDLHHPDADQIRTKLRHIDTGSQASG
jgi:tetratricopeptide (TPR) repeat protein